VKLPYGSADGSDVYLGDPGYGYPPSLYPNLTYTNPGDDWTITTTVSSNGMTIGLGDNLILGPLIVNESYALLSVTAAMVNNTSLTQVLGWLTVLVDASMLFQLQKSPEGLGDTGEVLIIGPNTADNHFDTQIRNSTAESVLHREVRFVLPPSDNSTLGYRHSKRASTQNVSIPFEMQDYAAVVRAWTSKNHAANNAGAIISTHNEEGNTVSVGYAVVANPAVDWVLVVEQAKSEVVAPINHLRNVVLACVFAVTGFLILSMFPLAHYSIAPIRQLRAATKKTVEPYQPDDGSSYAISSRDEELDDEEEESYHREQARKEGFFAAITRRKNRDGNDATNRPRMRRRTFRIPSKVPERKHWVTDELTDLTSTFNDMSDELTMQYERLEERVKERTAELEKAKATAESANQSKTLFIANISHELKTPLNGILGLTTVCMQEDDIQKIRSTLGTIYKSGDLLLHLLTDLLTFSKNEVGQQLAIDEAEFRLSDLSTQLIPTFEKQAREGQIDLKVFFLGTSDAFGNTDGEPNDKLYGPSGTGRIRDMCLWGDKNRILQVLMNFVSNSLKFTPAHGSVTIRIRCVGLMDALPSRAQSARNPSMTSKQSNRKKGRNSNTSLQSVRFRDQNGSETENDSNNNSNKHSNTNSVGDTKLSINVGGESTQMTKIAQRRRSMSPPPLNTKDLAFDFEVEDTGPGIPVDQQKKIFEPFVQGDLGLSKKYGGTGLGLSICAQLAALMGGDVSLDSTEGVGSKFSMRIPLRYVTERSASTSSSTYRPHSKASSLVGQTLHDTSDSNVPGNTSRTSLGSYHGDETSPSKLADVPRIVGFTAPYVAKEPVQESSSSKLQEMKKAETEAAKKGRRVRVLVAEDNQVNQEVVTRMLKLEDVYSKFCQVLILMGCD